jgi:hypothetical protein
MRKTIICLISLVILLSFVRPLYAGISTEVSISELPSYLRTDNFKLGYTAISDDPGSITAQFYFKKDGGSYQTVGPILSGPSGYVQITGTEVSEQAKYYFKVEVNGSVTDETSFTYDVSGPDPVSNFKKESKGGGSYKLSWRNPTNGDFARVFIYQSPETSFSAEGSTQVADLTGGADSDMTWEGTFDSSKDHYFAIRAVDKAGNGSGIVSDVPGTIETSSTSVLGSTQSGVSGKVTSLPKEDNGEVLSEKTTETPSITSGSDSGVGSDVEKSIIQKLIQFAKDRTKITLLILAGLGLLGFVLYKYFTAKKDTK